MQTLDSVRTTALRSAFRGSQLSKVLAVEDDSSVADFLSELLNGAGHAVIMCASYDAAMSAMNHATFDVVFADIDLRCREGNGLDLLRKRPERNRTARFL